MEKLLLLPFLLAPFLGSLFIRACKNKLYQKTAYYKATMTRYSSLDRGKHGEYLIYKYLQRLECEGSKFLFNLYLPKENNETTEIDVLMICSRGIFVFESKNLSGWIFGNEADKNWTQTLPSGRQGDCRKIAFYNPIMQNASHIRHLKHYVNKNIPMYSIIVFSERCTLKSITLRNHDVKVINHNDLPSVVDQIWSKSQPDLLTQIEINEIYSQLYPYTQVNHEVREQHRHSVLRHSKEPPYNMPCNDSYAHMERREKLRQNSQLRSS